MFKKTLLILSVLLLLTMIFGSTAMAGGKKDPMLFDYAIAGTSETYVDLEAIPGQPVFFSIKLTNSGTTTKTNYLFVCDGVTANNGGTAILTPQEAVRENVGSWFDITQEEVTLKSGQRKVFDFTAAVPSDAQPGTHVAVIYLRSGINPGVESDKTDNGTSFVINEVYSLSSAVILRTPGETRCVFSVDDTVKKEWIKDKDLTLFFRIANTGNIYDYPAARLDLYDDSNSVYYTTEKALGVVYPDNACGVDFTIPQDYCRTNISKAKLTLMYDKGAKTVDQEFSLTVLPEELDAVQKAADKQNSADLPVEAQSITQEGKLGYRESSALVIGIFLLMIIVVFTLILRHQIIRRRLRRRGV